ncbi:Acetyl-coenzyme A carboxylase carboxyl transferase subunit alpha [Apilactobacillus kunkeei]|uniref:acetyl-CoA carboxytransferase n=1 Tax=Apilactobacillus kunkeei DSM 12361 = ATCC 700308 TaxID=1423768 RepID=A0A0R1FLB1_9LACO|nr:carboxyltransferase subunit alpha [Apilactobacillus kunkeei]KOY72788.1 Acetyl-coenzyme A carboxylase carboxyl transferase subunit alpha [Apilactobacillus kunkeei DSM 12361 = ATCC 700308]KPN81769.1 Acetyl-coenzyme A carboxylase carboxyl transferase subunit alpha [Apilactobacillus kunkeei]KRK22537.1 acetyl-CoA carboxylase, carboxyl transferase subunit alpha [Apilactobacillus kunkeei DSM 12361 = ATCC 700308]MCK8625446.1 acetyl-CoA carboxylase carboxyl transferase subunit alpha [Apilactobacillus
MVKAYDRVLAARSADKISIQDLVAGITDDFMELHGDRAYSDDPAVYAGIGTIAGQSVTITSIQKGNDTDENIERHFGSAEPSGYRKALRLMKQAEKFNRPIINLINTPGAYPGMDAEYKGQGYMIAQSIMQGLKLKVPYISVIVGEGGSGGALALAVGDTVWALEDSIYSVLSPEGYATILWKDSSKAAEAAEQMQLTPKELLDNEIIDKIIPEVKDAKSMQNFKEALIEKINELNKLPKEELLAQRHERYRKFN